MLYKLPNEPAEHRKLRKRNFAKPCDTCCFYLGGRSCIAMETSWPGRNSSPEDQGEEAGVKGTMEKRALRDYQGRKGIGGGRAGVEPKRRKSVGCGLGYFTRVFRAENQVSAAGPEADRTRPWTLMGGGIFLVKTEFTRVKQFVICINFATSFCKRKRGRGKRLKIFKISHFNIFKNETFSVFT